MLFNFYNTRLKQPIYTPLFTIWKMHSNQIRMQDSRKHRRWRVLLKTFILDIGESP